MQKKLIYMIVISGMLMTGCNVKKSVEHGKPEAKANENKNPSVNIKPNQKIASPFRIKVNSEAVWFGHEGELGTVHVVDDNDKELGMAILSLHDDYNKYISGKAVMYGKTLSFNTQGATSGKLQFYNNNPSETEGVNKQFEIPVLFEEQIIPNPNDQLIGRWYGSAPEDISFQLNSDGTAKSLSMATLVYHRWQRINKHQVRITTESMGNHTSSISNNLYNIKYVDNKKLILTFLYNGKETLSETFYKR
jgi:hypothetical protein